MMMFFKLKKVLIIIIVLLAIFNILLIINKRKLSDKFYLINRKADQINQYEGVIRNNFKHKLLNNARYLDNELILFNINNEIVNINHICNSGYKLIIYYSELACSSCIEEELKIIKNYSSIIGNNNVIVITSFNNSRKTKVFKKTHNIGFDVYFSNSVGLPFEKENTLFMFICDSTLQVRHFFIPYASVPELSDEYYSIICKRYF